MTSQCMLTINCCIAQIIHAEMSIKSPGYILIATLMNIDIKGDFRIFGQIWVVDNFFTVASAEQKQNRNLATAAK